MDNIRNNPQYDFTYKYKDLAFDYELDDVFGSTDEAAFMQFCKLRGSCPPIHRMHIVRDEDWRRWYMFDKAIVNVA